MASLKITHFWSNLLAWNTNRHIFQFDGTIKWKATERSKGALKQLSKVKERQRSSLAWPISLSYELETKVRTLLMVPQAGVRDRMENVLEYIINITMEINFSSKVYSKSLLKVGSLKGSVVYSLILNYQFCACVMRTSGVPQLQVIHMECLYGYK